MSCPEPKGKTWRMPCRGIPAAAVFSPVPAASYPCGPTGNLGGQRGEQTIQGSKCAAKQMYLMREEEPEVLPCMRAVLPAVGTSPGELPASSGPTRVPWAPMGWVFASELRLCRGWRGALPARGRPEQGPFGS